MDIHTRRPLHGLVRNRIVLDCLRLPRLCKVPLGGRAYERPHHRRFTMPTTSLFRCIRRSTTTVRHAIQRWWGDFQGKVHMGKFEGLEDIRCHGASVLIYSYLTIAAAHL